MRQPERGTDPPRAPRRVDSRCPCGPETRHGAPVPPQGHSPMATKKPAQPAPSQSRRTSPPVPPPTPPVPDPAFAQRERIRQVAGQIEAIACEFRSVGEPTRMALNRVLRQRDGEWWET